jgi:capsular exopolysaccharide synthesis family protein
MAPAVRALTTVGSSEPQASGILTIIWRRRWLFVSAVVLAAVGAGLYLSQATPMYRASAQIYAQQGTPKILAEALALGSGSMNYLYTQCDLIRSTAVVSAAIASPEVRQCRTLRNVEAPVGYVKRAVDAQVGKQSDIITVSVEAPYAEDAALLANAVVDAYIAYQADRQKSTAGEYLKSLQKEKEKYEAELAATTKAMTAFRQANPAVSFGGEGKGNVVTQRLDELSNQLTQAQLNTLHATLLLDAANAVGTDPIKLKQLLISEQGANSPAASAVDNSDLWGDYRRLKRVAQQAREVYGAEHWQVKQYERQLQQLQADIMELDGATVGNYLAVIQQQYNSAKAREQELQKILDAQKPLAVELNTKEAEYQQLEYDAKRAQNYLEGVLVRMKDLNFSQETPQRIDVLEVARPAHIPVKPDYPKTMGMALVLGILAGTGLSLLRDWMDQRMRSIEEIRGILDLPVLGAIPHMVGKRPPAERGQEVHLRPRSNVAEAYRTVRTALYFGTSADPKSKTMLVTSPSPGDGKTTMASNLAIAMAQSGRRVILIDADMRKPMQHRVFNLKDETGLSTVLLGQTKVEQTVQRTQVENLDVLPCGPLPTNPSEALNSQQFIDLINLLSLRYDQIVIDSPPVEPVTDARILAASCDMTLLVLRAEKSTRRLSVHARDALIGVGASLLGVIVNDVPRGQDGYSYYSGYGYYHYGYGNGRNGNGSSASSGRKEIKAIPVASGAATGTSVED